MLAKKGEPMECPSYRIVSSMGRPLLEKEKARRADLKKPAPVTEEAAPAQPAPARIQPPPAETEHARVLSILSVPEAEGRTELAMRLATDTDLHSVEAIAALRLTPRWQSAAEAGPLEQVLSSMTLEQRVADVLESRAESKGKAGRAAMDAANTAEVERILATMSQWGVDARP